MKKPVFLKQNMMIKVVYALVPVLLTAIYYFGWRIALVVAISTFFAVLTEWIMSSYRNGKISQAVYVTAILYGLSLPPTVPLWIAAVGAVVAIFFAKEVFGGFGKNIFNPAIVGRAFVYVSFPRELTSGFVPVFRGFPGGFGHWDFASLKETPEYLKVAGLKLTGAITAATPMWSRRDYGYVTELRQLFLGNIGGVFQFDGNPLTLAAGSAGEICALVIMLAGIYLMVTKTAKWQLTVSTLVGAAVFNLLLRNIFGIQAVPPVLFTLLSGGFLFAAVFMVTDPISAPKLPLSQWLYGLTIGALIVFFRYKAIFAGGVGFAVLMGNMLAPSFDLWIKRWQTGKKGA
ncbi:MAG: RnfABCDGE type electron transport complex subunit D [Candidatus Marinimicrobia bacterium]|nr:RnfABCDGE type electron transport complex subunit D [Candidatus Neomarinimicrobiota bacterium]